MKARPTDGNIPVAVLAFLCGLSLAGCHRSPESARPFRSADPAVARVDGEAVWASDVRREAIAQGLISRGETLDMTSDEFRRVLDEVIDEKLLAREAVRRSLDKTSEARRGLAWTRQRVLADLVLEDTVNKAVTDRTVAGLYQEMIRSGDGPAPTLETARPRIIRFLTYDQVKDKLLDLRHQARIVSLLPPPPLLPRNVKP